MTHKIYRRDPGRLYERLAEVEARALAAEATVRELETQLEDAVLQHMQWKQRAERLRNDMAPFKEHAAWVQAQSVGRTALCNRLIVELARVSPGNPLLRKDLQQRIVNQAAQNNAT